MQHGSRPIYQQPPFRPISNDDPWKPIPSNDDVQNDLPKAEAVAITTEKSLPTTASPPTTTTEAKTERPPVQIIAQPTDLVPSPSSHVGQARGYNIQKAMHAEFNDVFPQSRSINFADEISAFFGRSPPAARRKRSVTATVHRQSSIPEDHSPFRSAIAMLLNRARPINLFRGLRDSATNYAPVDDDPIPIYIEDERFLEDQEEDRERFPLVTSLVDTLFGDDDDGFYGYDEDGEPMKFGPEGFDITSDADDPAERRRRNRRRRRPNRHRRSAQFDDEYFHDPRTIYRKETYHLNPIHSVKEQTEKIPHFNAGDQRYPDSAIGLGSGRPTRGSDRTTGFAFPFAEGQFNVPSNFEENFSGSVGALHVPAQAPTRKPYHETTHHHQEQPHHVPEPQTFSEGFGFSDGEFGSEGAFDQESGRLRRPQQQQVSNPEEYEAPDVTDHMFGNFGNFLDSLKNSDHQELGDDEDEEEEEDDDFDFRRRTVPGDDKQQRSEEPRSRKRRSAGGCENVHVVRPFFRLNA